MEQTQLFQATVRTIRLRMKTQRREENGGTTSSIPDTTSILKKQRRKTEFAREATDVVRLLYTITCTVQLVAVSLVSG